MTDQTPGGLQIRTLGSLEVVVDGSPVEIRSAKALALLVYLAETARPHHRSSLAGLLWPDRPEAAARNNLRQALTALRKAIGDRIVAQADRVQLGGHVDIDTRPITPDGYRGPFLEGFSLPDSDLFDEWATRTRTSHEVIALALFLDRADASLRSGATVDGMVAVQRVLDMEPWNEQAHRIAMRLLASEGRRHEAVEQYDRCTEALWEHLGIQPSPETDAILADVEQAGQRPGPVDYVDAPSTPLFGRGSEIERLSAWLVSGERRLVSLVGPGGIGKTRLALAIAAESETSFEQGVVVAALEGVDDAGRVATSIAAACDVPSAGGDPVELGRRLAGRHQLIVVDNAEQVAEAVADAVAALLSHAPRLSVIVTSRTVLGLASEHVEWMEGLDTEAGPDTTICSAVELFIDRARRVTRDVAPGATIQSICERLGGLPLAIELAAGRMGHLSPDEILESLRSTTDELVTDLRDVAQRHRSITGLLDDTFSSLDGGLAGLLERLSVFRGGFDRPAAVAVAGADARSLQQLTSRSLLILRGAGRYEIHELVRQYASVRLDRSPAAQATHDAHARHYLGVLADTEPLLYGSDSRTIIGRLMPDIDNIAAAWMRSVAAGDQAPIREALLAMYRLGFVTGRAREIVDLMENAAAAFEGPVRAELLGYVLALTWARFPIEDSEARFERALAAIESTSEQERRAHVMALAGFGQAIAEQRGETDRARQLFEEARDILADLEDPSLEAYVQVASAKNEVTSGNFDRAHEYLEPALAHYEAVGNVAGAANALSRLAMVSAEQYRVGKAIEADREALRLYTAIGDRTRAADLALNLGADYALVGAWDLAERHTLDAAAFFDEVGDTTILPYILCQRAEIRDGRGDHDEAERLFTEGIAQIRDTRYSLGLRLKLPEWARFLVLRQRHHQALLVAREAAEVWNAIGGEHFLLTSNVIASRALAGLGRVDEALELAERAWKEIDERRAVGLPYPIESIVDCAVVLGDSHPGYERLMALGRRVVDTVVADIVEPDVRACFLDLPDVRLVLG